MKISLVTVQMTSTPKVSDNLRWLEKQLSLINTELPTLVVLPECFACFGGQDRAQLDIAESFGHGPIQDFIASQAKKLGIWIVAGSMPIKSADPDKFLATSLLFSDDGNCRAQYHKMHLFDVEVEDATGVYRESRTTQAGNSVVVVDSQVGKIGLSICYDIRFPELYRTMQQQGVDIICLPSAFTQTTGAAHWRALLRARAIENQAFIVAANQSGCHQNQRQTYGHSMVIDPWGEVIQDQNTTTGIMQSTVDLEMISAVRKRMPNLKHRKIF